MIDKKFLEEYAQKVKRCPKCRQKSLCLIYFSEEFGENWECAETLCCYNPGCAGCRAGKHGKAWDQYEADHDAYRAQEGAKKTEDRLTH